MHDTRFDELAALAAIDALDPAERDEFGRHLSDGCLVCRRELDSFRRTAAELALAVPAAQPPPGLRSRLPVRERKRLFPTGRLALAAAVVLAFVAGDDVRQRTRVSETSTRLAQARLELSQKNFRASVFEDPDVQAFVLGGLGPQPRSKGRIYFSSRARKAILLAVNLESLPPGRQYELWMIAGGIPVAAGAFDACPTTTVFESISLPESAGERKFAVTIEPRGGVPRPTGPMILLGPA